MPGTLVATQDMLTTFLIKGQRADWEVDHFCKLCADPSVVPAHQLLLLASLNSQPQPLLIEGWVTLFQTYSQRLLDIMDLIDKSRDDLAGQTTDPEDMIYNYVRAGNLIRNMQMSAMQVLEAATLVPVAESNKSARNNSAIEHELKSIHLKGLSAGVLLLLAEVCQRLFVCLSHSTREYALRVRRPGL